MTSTIRRTVATAAASIVLLAAAACSNETEGEGSPASQTKTSAAETSESDESDTSESESDESDTSESDAPGGSEEATDGSFSYELPPGFEDAQGEINVPGAILTVADLDSDPSFPTNIVVTSGTSSGTIEQAAEEVRKEIESKFSTTTSADGPDESILPDIDGEEYTTWTTGDYKDGDQDVASAQIVTKHDGTFYFITVNTLPSNKSDAGSSLVELAKTIKWS
ncbi:hypothetical protein [Blastococcus sp. Marseille-P5729]|uniref:hypothetical protein n=1 Tax=Blastococcus sp. Marseille-P5729 TaxID=2086582 RepID=UPI000D0EA4FD|nr:hypothetical protein [Blastococcus sp. Marseille-P5729]